MIERIPYLPANAVGFSAKGTVTANDYDSVIIPAVEAMFSGRDKVRLLYYLGEEFKGFEAAAMWDDTKLYLKHLAGWQKVAFVSNVEWIHWAVKIFALAMPGQVRVFHNHEFSAAKRWLSA